MNQLQAMRVFTRVVDLASFNLAARQLGMSAAAVTRSISMLEAHLNMRLLNRSTRSLSLTEAGREYLEGCREIIEKLDAMESNLSRATRDPRGTLRIASSALFASNALCETLAAYREQHPRVDFDVTTFDSRIDMVEGGYDVCFSESRRLNNSTLVSRPLTMVGERVVATPAYLAEHGTPKTPHDLNEHSLLTVSDGATRAWEFEGDDGVCRVFANGALAATGCTMIRTAALNHMGIALLPETVIVDDLRQGALVQLFEDQVINGGPREVSILYPSRNYMSMKVRSFIDFVVNRYRELAAAA